MKKVLLVGANGLVGRHFQSLYNKKYHIHPVHKESHFSFDHCDEIDALVFLAQSKEYTLKGFSEDLINTNVVLLRQYLHHLSGKCPKIILFSTGSVYQESHHVIDESSPLVSEQPTPYAASKLMSELLAKSYFNVYPSITIVRPFTIYGKGLRSSMLFSRIQNSLINGTPIELGNEGGIEFNPVHAEDVAHFIDYVINRKTLGIEYLNIFGPEIVTLKQVIDKMAAQLDATPMISKRDWPFKRSVASTQHHDFIPTLTLQCGLQKMLAGVNEHAE